MHYMHASDRDSSVIAKTIHQSDKDRAGSDQDQTPSNQEQTSIKRQRILLYGSTGTEALPRRTYQGPSCPARHPGRTSGVEL